MEKREYIKTLNERQFYVKKGWNQCIRVKKKNESSKLENRRIWWFGLGWVPGLSKRLDSKGKGVLKKRLREIDCSWMKFRTKRNSFDKWGCLGNIPWRIILRIIPSDFSLKINQESHYKTTSNARLKSWIWRDFLKIKPELLFLRARWVIKSRKTLTEMRVLWSQKPVQKQRIYTFNLARNFWTIIKELKRDLFWKRHYIGSIFSWMIPSNKSSTLCV